MSRMSNMAKNEYLVPRETKTKMEIFPGFGFIELGAVAAGMALGGVLQLIPVILPLPIGPKLFARLFIFTLPAAMAYMLFKQDTAGNSLYQQLRAFRTWSSRPKVYYYKRRGF